MMKNWMIAVCLLLLAACSDDIYDKLDGKWQLQQVEENGIVQNVDTIYYNFQTSLFMYQIYDPGLDDYRQSFGFNTKEGDNKLLIELTSNPKPVESFLKYTDWPTPQKVFIIEKADRKKLILESDGKRYIFRKF
ncbi:hypothetical protein DW095_09335 [Bacteroides sp. AM07-16]|nr:hypothetical protein DW095_09335 [Bacteroides sp. AM07-16]